MSLFNWFKKDKDAFEAYQKTVLEDYDKAKKEIEESLAVKEKLPYNMDNISAPIITIAEKVKENPSRFKVRKDLTSRRNKYIITDKVTKVTGSVIRSSVYYIKPQIWITLDKISLTFDEKEYLEYHCKGLIEERVDKVLLRRKRLKAHKENIREQKARDEMQRLFEES